MGHVNTGRSAQQILGTRPNKTHDFIDLFVQLTVVSAMRSTRVCPVNELFWLRQLQPAEIRHVAGSLLVTGLVCFSLNVLRP